MTNTVSIQISQYHAGEKHLFRDFNIQFSPQKTTVILGGSGVGKSTLLKMLSGLIKDSGVSVNENEALFDFKQISYMAQDDLLMPWRSVLNNVLLGHKLRGKVKPEVIDRAKLLLEQVGLKKEINHNPLSLSGGMRQRVALVRTLMEDKPIVLMDEPFSALDIGTRYELQNLSANLLADKTVVLVTHDPKEALRLGHRIVVLGDNPAKIVCDISPKDKVPRNLISKAIKTYEDKLIEALLGRGV